MAGAIAGTGTDANADADADADDDAEAKAVGRGRGAGSGGWLGKPGFCLGRTDGGVGLCGGIDVDGGL